MIVNTRGTYTLEGFDLGADVLRASLVNTLVHGLVVRPVTTSAVGGRVEPAILTSPDPNGVCMKIAVASLAGSPVVNIVLASHAWHAFTEGVAAVLVFAATEDAVGNPVATVVGTLISDH